MSKRLDKYFAESRIARRRGRHCHATKGDIKTDAQGAYNRDNSSKDVRTSEVKQQIEKEDDGSSTGTKVAASFGVAAGVALLVLGGVVMKDQIRAFLDFFIGIVDDWGPMGYVAYAIVYAGLELLAVPAIPLTMTAGVIFGVGGGTAVVSVASTLAATGAFLIARYVARDRVAEWAKSNPKFSAIDRAIGKEGFRVVALLRLSPLLPLAASNYLYGLTSVDLKSYVLASWLGMLPGTLAYVAAGMYGRDFLLGVEGGRSSFGGVQIWQLGIGVGVTALALVYMGRLATKALADVDIENEEDGPNGRHVR